MNALLRPLAGLVLTLMLALGNGACSSQTRYTPRTSGELTWGYDDQLVLRDGAREVARAGSWDGLAQALVCVPEAAAEAELAESRATSGAVLRWTGVGLLAGGLGGGAALMATQDEPLAGLSVMVGSLLTSLVPLLLSANHESASTVNAVNAVNRHNDEASGCLDGAAHAARRP